MASAAPPPSAEGRAPLASRVLDEIERRILAGAMRPGTQLVEEDLATALDVSRGPVREAFRALEQKGLVCTIPHRGVFVREVTVQEADEIYAVRAGLDELIGRLLAPRMTAAQLAELRTLITRMEMAAVTENVDAYYPLNFEFHDLLARSTGNATLLTTYRALVNCLHLYRRTTLARGKSSFPTSAREHHEIVDALARGDGDRAGALLYAHAMESRDRLHTVLDARTPASPKVSSTVRRKAPGARRAVAAGK